MALGAVRFVAKPVESAVLLQAVEQVLIGQPAEASELERERSAVESARARAAAAAARLCATLAAEGPALGRSLPVVAEWVSRYFGIAPAGVALAEDNGIRLAGVSRDSFIPARTKLSSKLLFETGVLAAGSSFLATENAELLRGPHGREYGLQFLVAVPLLFEDVPIGALGLFDRVPHPFTAEDLLILEGVGRNFSEALRPESPLLGNLGVRPVAADGSHACERARLASSRARRARVARRRDGPGGERFGGCARNSPSRIAPARSVPPRQRDDRPIQARFRCNRRPRDNHLFALCSAGNRGRPRSGLGLDRRHRACAGAG